MDRMARFRLPFRRQLGLAYVAGLLLLLGVEGLWYHNVTQLVTTLQRPDSRAAIIALGPTERRALERTRSDARAAVTRTVAVTGAVFILAVAMSGLAVLRTEREMDRRRDAERQAIRARDEAERMSLAKSEFLTLVSHELRTPLNSVIGFSNVLLRNSATRTPAEEITYLERIRANGMHLLNLIDELLDLAKIEAGKEELEVGIVSLEQLICETVAQLEGRVVGKDLVLRAEVPPVIAPLVTDERKLKQVLINLIGNAVKFTDRGSVTTRVTIDPETTEATRIDVIDTGIGIPEHRQRAIFEPFEQADRSAARRHDGTGLGLAIAQEFCNLMGYRLSVASEAGKGSTFTIELPRVSQAGRARPTTPEIASMSAD